MCVLVCVCASYVRVIEKEENEYTDGAFVAPGKLIAKASRKTCGVFGMCGLAPQLNFSKRDACNGGQKEKKKKSCNFAAQVVTELHTPSAAGFTPAVQFFSH